MFVGLVKDPDPGWRSFGDLPEPSRGRHWDVPWRHLVWVAVLVAVFALVPLATDVVGALAGYGMILGGVALGGWRLDRLLGPVSRGLRDYRQGF